MTEKVILAEVMFVMTTESSLEKAEFLAESILMNKYAACITFRQISSLYFWKGNIEKSQEVEILIKTNSSTIQKLFKLIEDLHSYDLPELVSWKVDSSQEYYKWINDSVLNQD
tara:strand:+ start:589 stop:927 length:339 start_codon:yes stop_codon:yes gene_type:complete